MVALTAKAWADSTSVQPVPTTRGCIDPNVAPWWELAALPRIGIGTARAIVRFREDVAADTPADRAFQSAAELARVRGIGPKTALRIASYVCFGNG